MLNDNSNTWLVLQVVKILSQYTPQSDAEERVTLNFIRIVQVQWIVKLVDTKNDII